MRFPRPAHTTSAAAPLLTLLTIASHCATEAHSFTRTNIEHSSSPLVHKEKLSEKDSLKNLQKDMLQLFGHKNRPRPDIFSSMGRTTSSAIKYMQELYQVKIINEDRNNEEDPEDQYRETNNVSTTQKPSTESIISTDPIASESADKADTIVSFVNHGYRPRPNASDEDGSMYFDLSSNLVIETTLASELRLYLDVLNRNTNDNVFVVTVYQIVVPRKKWTPLIRRIVNATGSSWHEFNIISAAKLWREHPYTNKGLLLTCETMTGRRMRNRDCGIVDFNGDNDKRPFLVTFYNSGRDHHGWGDPDILADQIPEEEEHKMYALQRVRRSLRNLFPRAQQNPEKYKDGTDRHGKKSSESSKKRDDTQHCRRNRLYISFKDLKWSDWIIAPSGFQAEFCKGECTFPLGRNMNASNHAIIQTLVHLMSPKRIPEPCCAPLRLSPLQVLYLDDSNNVVMKKYANMIVKDCGCQ